MKIRFILSCIAGLLTLAGCSKDSEHGDGKSASTFSQLAGEYKHESGSFRTILIFDATDVLIEKSYINRNDSWQSNGVATKKWKVSGSIFSSCYWTYDNVNGGSHTSDWVNSQFQFVGANSFRLDGKIYSR